MHLPDLQIRVVLKTTDVLMRRYLSAVDAVRPKDPMSSMFISSNTLFQNRLLARASYTLSGSCGSSQCISCHSTAASKPWRAIRYSIARLGTSPDGGLFHDGAK